MLYNGNQRAKTFLSDACQPERGHFELLGDGFAHVFAQIFSWRGKKLRYTNLVASRHIKRLQSRLTCLAQLKAPCALAPYCCYGLSLPITVVSESSLFTSGAHRRRKRLINRYYQYVTWYVAPFFQNVSLDLFAFWRQDTICVLGEFVSHIFEVAVFSCASIDVFSSYTFVIVSFVFFAFFSFSSFFVALLWPFYLFFVWFVSILTLVWHSPVLCRVGLFGSDDGILITIFYHVLWLFSNDVQRECGYGMLVYGIVSTFHPIGHGERQSGI